MIQFQALSYSVGMAPRLFHKIEVLSFQKMYGGTCHPKWYQQPPWLMDYNRDSGRSESNFNIPNTWTQDWIMLRILKISHQKYLNFRISWKLKEQGTSSSHGWRYQIWSGFNKYERSYNLHMIDSIYINRWTNRQGEFNTLFSFLKMGYH